MDRFLARVVKARIEAGLFGKRLDQEGKPAQLGGRASSPQTFLGQDVRMGANCGDCGATVDPDGPSERGRSSTHLHISILREPAAVCSRSSFRCAVLSSTSP
jgi:hypothetical protein